MIIQKLKQAGLYVKGEKCEFQVEETSFLGFIVGINGTRINPKKNQLPYQVGV